MKKYLALYNTLVAQIDEGVYKAGDLLPFEKELIDSYELSRDTVRKALSLLENEGYINKVKGKGSVVLDRAQYHFSMNRLTSFKELSDKTGMSVITRVHSFALSDGEVGMREKLGLSSREKLWQIVRTRNVDGMTIILDKDYLLHRHVPTLDMNTCEHSIFDYLENELGLKIGFAQKEIVVEAATEEDITLLELGDTKVVAVIRSYVFLQEGELLQFSESRHRADKFRFTDFARRLPG